MALHTWLLSLGLAMLPAVLMAQETQNQPSVVPPLPAEEKSAINLPEPKPEESNVVVNYDAEPKSSAFFSDTSFNTGHSRSFNALDLSGYLRTRFSYFRDAHLKTYVPGKGGTSNVPPNLSFFDTTVPLDPDEDDMDKINPSQNNFSGNMRLRVNPTLNVSEVVRVKASFDVFDNMVLGSTPSYLSRGRISPSSPSSLMSMSQNPPMMGINSWQGAINIKRAYAEASFPIGEVRFGRMPFHWGLGILYHSGDELHADHGDQIDGISFTTRIFDYFITPSYSIAYTGPIARGGGHFPNTADFQSIYLPAEMGQRYPLESGDLTHVFMLSFLKRESDFIINRKRQEGRGIYNFGFLTSYRRQSLDTQAYAIEDNVNFADLARKTVKRESHVGLLSFWQAFSYDTLHIEMEAAGILGRYQINERAGDSLGDGGAKRNIWMLKGGVALESRYGFLNDRLRVGLDAGWASAQNSPGMGIRDAKADPSAGDPDGRRAPQRMMTNFKFNPGYAVDLLLHREVLGGISGTVYVKPHIEYLFSRNFGVRGDIITSIAPRAANTAGNSNWLGVEFDASSYLRSDNGFYFQLGYGLLVPLKGLNHRAGTLTAKQFKDFGEARVAQTLQGMVGVTF